jgi:hypothetical protein
LTERDRKLLKLLGEYGCVSADRIKAQFWPGSANSRAHYRRLAILKQENWVETVYGDGATPLGYRLTRKGRKMVGIGTDVTDLAAQRRGYKTQYEHDQLLIDVRRIFEGSPLVRGFRTEAEIKRAIFRNQTKIGDWRNAPTVPDAIFTFDVPGHPLRIVVELELTAKSRNRYTKILSNHLLAQDWDVVFYLVRGDEFLLRLRALLGEIRQTEARVRVANEVNGIYFCSLDKFLAEGLAAPFVGEKREISLKEMANRFGGK